MVFTRTEVKQLLAHLDGGHRLSASLLDGTGRRLAAGLKRRAKDVDFEYRR
ncbi:hypothetical protein H6F86_12080 [Phormidium sp. FACHB-592]|uniref:Uncharacterized protein n=1 Tax=Stenomitos frigidus AS-A4 TaxID=2933935 RepID=A0ABV0KS00_9CYAN|nr:hypothetical protein [Phormidium sp. FACHB-592]MBD2074612.1 hypothetical protein [Phormidium sp. FACHB-592]